MAANKLTPERRSPKDKGCQTRTIKVRGTLYSRTIKDKHHAHFDRTLETTVPWITMKGQWLNQAGFPTNTPVKIRVMPGCLVLTAQTD